MLLDWMCSLSAQAASSRACACSACRPAAQPAMCHSANAALSMALRKQPRFYDHCLMLLSR